MQMMSVNYLLTAARAGCLLDAQLGASMAHPLHTHSDRNIASVETKGIAIAPLS
jgi:hypothetical protein